MSHCIISLSFMGPKIEMEIYNPTSSLDVGTPLKFPSDFLSYQKKQSTFQSPSVSLWFCWHNLITSKSSILLTWNCSISWYEFYAWDENGFVLLYDILPSHPSFKGLIAKRLLKLNVTMLMLALFFAFHVVKKRFFRLVSLFTVIHYFHISI